MGRSKSSQRWLQEHFNDHYVQRAKQSGYRSRASFKLLEMDKRDHLFKPGMRVIDLGAAPGGWSQVIIEKTGSTGQLIASDILPMDPIAGVRFVQGDFTDESVLQEILHLLENSEADLVTSDMAPNISGIRSADQAGSIYLAELALDLSCRVLRQGGGFLVKVFQGAGFDNYLHNMKMVFKKVVTRKPGASRSRSREVYLLGQGYKKTESEICRVETPE